MSEPKRITLALSSETSPLLDFLISHQQTTQVEAVRRAIATESLLLGESLQGSKILIETKDGTIKQLIFR